MWFSNVPDVAVVVKVLVDVVVCPSLFSSNVGAVVPVVAFGVVDVDLRMVVTTVVSSRVIAVVLASIESKWSFKVTVYLNRMVKSFRHFNRKHYD